MAVETDGSPERLPGHLHVAVPFGEEGELKPGEAVAWALPKRGLDVEAGSGEVLPLARCQVSCP